MPDPTPLEAALAEACAFALRHGVEPPISPADFGIQRSEAGHTCATYVDGDYAVTVDVDAAGAATFGIAELSWFHFPNPENPDDEDCDVCHPDDGEPTHHRGVALQTVYLPGDAPVEEIASVRL